MMFICTQDGNELLNMQCVRSIRQASERIVADMTTGNVKCLGTYESPLEAYRALIKIEQYMNAGATLIRIRDIDMAINMDIEGDE